MLLPGFHLREEFSQAQLMLFDRTTSADSEHETLCDWTMMVLCIFGAIHLALWPYKSFDANLLEVCVLS